ncbi:MAG: hypothetical protein WA152_03080 [Microgenomates group bacterium]
MDETNPAQTIVTTPQVVEQPKQNNFLIILLSTLLVISVSISGFFAYQTQKLVKELQGIRDVKEIVDTTEPVATTSSEVDPTTDWKTYTNDKFNFSFKYPKEMSYLYDQSDQYVENGISNAMILVQNFDGTKPRAETKNDLQIVVYISNKSGAFNLEDPQGEKTDITINGVKATKSYTTQKLVLVPTIFFQSSPNKIAIQLSNPDSTNKLWFDQIVSTFKFMK